MKAQTTEDFHHAIFSLMQRDRWFQPAKDVADSAFLAGLYKHPSQKPLAELVMRYKLSQGVHCVALSFKGPSVYGP